MMRLSIVLSLVCLTVAPSVQAQDAPTAIEFELVQDSSLRMFEVPHDYIVRAAKKMPAELYSFKPADEVRSFGEVVAHVADGNRLICAMAVGDRITHEFNAIEKSVTGKDAIIAALEESADYCRGVHERINARNATENVDFFGNEYPRIAMLFFNTSHAWEHYGNLVTYMRINDLVPPSSERR